MDTFHPDRDLAHRILLENIKSEPLLRHAWTMEAIMGYFAELFGETDVAKWKIIGLLHDIDYERYPEKHCHMVEQILSEKGFPKDYIRAIESHGYKLVNDVRPVHRMEQVLYATDELSGLIAAVARLRPSKSLLDLTVRSVKKKWKQKGFASGANRKVIEEGAEMLGMDLDLLIEHTIKGMQPIAEKIGL